MSGVECICDCINDSYTDSYYINTKISVWKRSLEYDQVSLMLGVPIHTISYKLLKRGKKWIRSVKSLLQLKGGIMVFYNF